MSKRNVSKTESQHIEHLSLVQIKNYLEERLDNSAKHEIERHLLDCDICREAFEGYQLMGVENVEEEVGNIIRVMRNRVGRQVPFYRNYRYYGVAASILLIAGIVFVFDLGPQPKEEIATKEETTEEVMEEENVAQGITDSTSIAADIEENEPVAEVQSSSEARDISKPEEPEQIPTASPVIAEVTEEIEEREEEAPVSQVFSALSEAREISPEVSSGAGLGQGDAEDRGFSPDLTDADESEELNFEGGEDVAAAPLKADDYLADPEPISQEQAKRQQSTGAISRAAAPATTDIEPQPIFGVDDYNIYLQSELNYPRLAIQNSIEGDVILKFTITTEGLPSNIEVTQSLGYGCDEEAIRLVQEGERWFPGTSSGVSVEKSVTLTVSFKLP